MGHYAVYTYLTQSPSQWAEALALFMQAADELCMSSRKSLWGQFWSSHQRFFKYLCIAAKVRCLVELAKKELKAGKVSHIRTLPNETLFVAIGILHSFFLLSSVLWLVCSQQVRLEPEKSSMKMTDAWTDLCLLQSKWILGIIKTFPKYTATLWLLLSRVVLLQFHNDRKVSQYLYYCGHLKIHVLLWNLCVSVIW